MPENNQTIYCIDSSAIIDLWKEDRGYYAKDVHSSLWETIESYIASEKIVSSIEVYEELKEDTEAEFRNWLKSNKSIFKEVDECQVRKIEEITSKYPLLAEGFKGKADHVLVSLCLCEKLVMLTTEKGSTTTTSQYTPKLPNLCDDYEVDCVNINDFCRREGIKI